MKRYPPPPHVWVACRGQFAPCAHHIAAGIPVREVRAAWSKAHHEEKKRYRLDEYASWRRAAIRDLTRAFAVPLRILKDVRP